MKLQVTYDRKADAFALSLGQVNGESIEMWEAYPWVRLEVGEESGDLLCVEVLGAAKTLGSLLKPLDTGQDFVCVSVEGEMSPIKDALLKPDGQAIGGYKEYVMFNPGEESAQDARLKQVRKALEPYLHLVRESNSAQTQTA